MWDTLDNIFGSMRNSIIALGIWFAIGLILLIQVGRVKTSVKMS